MRHYFWRQIEFGSEIQHRRPRQRIRLQHYRAIFRGAHVPHALVNAPQYTIKKLVCFAVYVPLRAPPPVFIIAAITVDLIRQCLALFVRQGSFVAAAFTASRNPSISV